MGGGWVLKIAVTDAAEVSVSWQVELAPLQAPPHPAKSEPATAVAVSVTGVFAGKFAVHVG